MRREKGEVPWEGKKHGGCVANQDDNCELISAIAEASTRY